MGFRKKNVIVSLWMHSCAGRRHLAGVFRYLARGRDWDVRLCRRSELTAEMLSGIDGVITSPHVDGGVLRIIQARRIPLVTIDIPQSELRSKGPVGRIYSDDRSVGLAAARHVLTYGNFRPQRLRQCELPQAALQAAHRQNHARMAMRCRRLR